jgi:hypothetical protein
MKTRLWAWAAALAVFTLGSVAVAQQASPSSRRTAGAADPAVAPDDETTWISITDEPAESAAVHQAPDRRPGEFEQDGPIAGITSAAADYVSYASTTVQSDAREPTTGYAAPNGSGSDLGFFGRWLKQYLDEWRQPMDPVLDPFYFRQPLDGAYRNAIPSPWPSPPFPGSEYQGYPLIGVPSSTSVYPFMAAVYGANTPLSNRIQQSRIKFEGWATGSGNWSTAKNSNTPDSYWIVPNRYELDQLVLKVERYADTTQEDHADWGFRSANLYGIDYRYTTAGGWFSAQLLKHNHLYGMDPVEEYVNVYVPGFLGGTDIRIGRWIACPDIETQYSVDNYLGSHSLLFTFDTYTQTGVMVTQKINNQNTFQAVLHSGTDMAPWYPGAVATGAFGWRWVAKDNNDAFYTWLNAINTAQFRHFNQYGQPLGHDNFNYIVSTWEHRFSPRVHTKTEGYFMWQYNAELGGTPSAGPVESFGGGGGDGVLLPGKSLAYGVLNYTMFGLGKRDYFTVRNEWWKDERGMRAGFAGNYTSHTIGISHQFNNTLMIRPEIGYFRNWNQPAFDLGTQKGIWIYGFDLTQRF